MVDRAIEESSKKRGEMFVVRRNDAAQCFGKADDVVRSWSRCQGYHSHSATLVRTKSIPGYACSSK